MIPYDRSLYFNRTPILTHHRVGTNNNYYKRLIGTYAHINAAVIYAHLLKYYCIIII